MMKKILSMCLAFCVVLSCFVTVSVNASNLTVSDIAEEAGLLQAIGVISSVPDEAEGNREITRAEFAVTAAKIMGIKAQNEDSRYFTDIPMDHWSISYINRLVELNIISLSPDKLFRPNDKITVNEAVKMLVCMCGYGDYAASVGGYPFGFTDVAARLDFEISGGAENLTIYKSFILLYDALCSPTYKKTAQGGGYVAYEESEDTMLSLYFDVYEAEGTVLQSSGISILGEVVTGGSSTDVSKLVRIDDETYTTSVNLYDYIGRNVHVFYVQADEDDTPNIIYRQDYKRDDEVLEISADDAEYKNGVLTYYDEKGRPEKEEIPMSAIIVKNGTVVKKSISEAFDIEKGSFRLIDIEDDGIIDVVLIFAHKNYVVDRISSESFTIYDKVVTGRKVVLDDKDKIVVVEDSTGALKSFSDIKVGQVISVYDSEDYVRVVIGPEAVTATLYATSFEDDVFKIQAGKSESDKAWYEVDTDYYNEYILGKYYTNSQGETVYTGDIDLTPGGTITYYKDADGKVAYITGPNPSGWTFAYLVRLGENEDEDKTTMKLYTQNGDLKVFNVADKVTIDGTVVKSHAEIKANLDKSLAGKTLGAGEDSVNGQLIRYKENAKGEIFAVDTENVNDAKEDRLSLHRSGAAQSLAWWYHTNSFYKGQYFYSSSTVKFAVPSHSELQSASAEDFTIMSGFADSTNYTVEGFKLNAKGGIEDALVIYGGASAVAWKGPYLVSKIYTSVGSDEDVVLKAELYDIPSGDILTVTAKDGYNFSSGEVVMGKGDIVRIGANNAGVVSNVTIWYDYSRKDDATYVENSPRGFKLGTNTYQESTINYLMSAQLKSIDDGIWKFVYGTGAEDYIKESDLTEENYSNCTWATRSNIVQVLIVEEDGKITSGTPADIEPATITGAENAPVYWFSIRLAQLNGAVVYK